MKRITKGDLAFRIETKSKDEIGYLATSFNDMTSRLEETKEEREKFANIMDIIGTGLCLLDKDLRIIWANKTICDWLDLKDSPVGNHCHDIYRCSEFEAGNYPVVKCL